MKLMYGLNEKPPFKDNLLYAMQWLAFNLVNIAVIPVVMGSALALNSVEVSELAQRTMFFVAISCILQVLFGHKLPIIEGPAGMWWGIFITLAAMAPSMGKSLEVLRADLELGMILAGVILAIIGLTGLMGKCVKLFTPPVTGTVLVLLTLQLSGVFVKGMLGVNEAGMIDLKAAFISLVVVSVVIFVNLKGRGFVKSIAVLIGTIVGWILAEVIGVTGGSIGNSIALIKIPRLFAWGVPSFDAGVVVVSIITGILVLANTVASIIAMEKILNKKLSEKVYNRGVMFTGVADILSGVGATVGNVSYASCAGLITITGVAARLPFLLFGIITLIMGLFPPIGAFLTSIPTPVGYSVLVVSYCQMLGYGFKDYASMKLSARDFLVIGLPIIIGAGIFSVPAESFNNIPPFLRYLVSNGFVLGMVLCILLEHVILPNKEVLKVKEVYKA